MTVRAEAQEQQCEGGSKGDRGARAAVRDPHRPVSSLAALLSTPHPSVSSCEFGYCIWYMVTLAS